jgi:hypothetical protein
MSVDLGKLDIVVERWWIRDSHNPEDLAWRAVIGHTRWGLTSAADATPWRAIARTVACLVLKTHGLYGPSQAQEELELVIARARVAAAMSESMRVQPARPRRQSRRRTA